MDIPIYPGSRPLDLGDKTLLDGIFSVLNPRISEFTFANLYLFRNAHGYRLTRVGGELAILAKGYDGEPYYLLPHMNGEGEAFKRLLDEGLTLYGADNPFIHTFLKGMEVDIVPDRDSFDYLYSRQDLADLPGNRYHKKRNRISYFMKRNEFVVEIFGEEHICGCLELLDEWRRVRDEGELDSSSVQESEAAAEALSMAAVLGLQGVVAIVGGRIKAFALGERLNSETSVCHFEKADPFLDGLYQFIDREFNRLLFIDCPYVNREQDLGVANLRRSKLSYRPVEMVEKYRVRRSGPQNQWLLP